MSIPQEYEQIVANLERATVERRVNWQISTGNKVFVAFPKYSISLMLYYGEGPQQEAEIGGIGIGLVNARGEQIDGFLVDKGNADFARIEILYRSAYRTAKKIDVTLDDLSKQLEQDGRIGIDPAPPRAGLSRPGSTRTAEDAPHTGDVPF